MVEDEKKLLNIPYIHDAPVDRSFLKELLTDYDGQVAGEDQDDYLDDATFLELINALIPYQIASNENHVDDSIESTSSGGSSAAKPFPCPEIFAAISKHFKSHTGTPEQLRER